MSSSNSRKLSGGYYDGPSDYGRSYSRNTLDYDRSQDYDRNRDREPEPDLRDSRDSRMTENRDSRHPRDLWDRDRDRDSRHYDDRRDVGDSKKEAFERHVSIRVFNFSAVNYILQKGFLRSSAVSWHQLNTALLHTHCLQRNTLRGFVHVC